MASPHCVEASASLNDNLEGKISCKTCNFCASLHCAQEVMLLSESVSE